MEYYVKKEKKMEETVKKNKDHHAITHQCMRAYR